MSCLVIAQLLLLASQPDRNSISTLHECMLMGSFARLLEYDAVAAELELSFEQKLEISSYLRQVDKSSAKVLERLRRVETERLAAEWEHVAARRERESFDEVKDILDAAQFAKLQRIRLRAFGMGSLLLPDVSEALGLSETQIARIKSICATPVRGQLLELEQQLKGCLDDAQLEKWRLLNDGAPTLEVRFSISPERANARLKVSVVVPFSFRTICTVEAVQEALGLTLPERQQIKELIERTELAIQVKSFGSPAAIARHAKAANESFNRDLCEILNEVQVKRLEQIRLQLMGVVAVFGSDLKESFVISPSQREHLEKLFRSSAANGARLDPSRASLAAPEEEIRAILTVEQLRKWDEVTGEQISEEIIREYRNQTSQLHCPAEPRETLCQ